MKELKGIKYIGFGKTSFSEVLKEMEKELYKTKNKKQKR